MTRVYFLDFCIALRTKHNSISQLMTVSLKALG